MKIWGASSALDASIGDLAKEVAGDLGLDLGRSDVRVYAYGWGASMWELASLLRKKIEDIHQASMESDMLEPGDSGGALLQLVKTGQHGKIDARIAACRKDAQMWRDLLSDVQAVQAD